jgi:hypothetical protein
MDKRRTIGSMSRPYFNKETIPKFLADHGYTSNPDGLIDFAPPDYVLETEDVAYLDVNAIAIRKGNEVPDRPIRMTFHRIQPCPSFGWELQSVVELAPGIQTKAESRDEYTPKISPWPDKT